MADTILIKNARIVNEGITQEGDLLIENGRIAHVDRHISPKNGNVKIIDAHGMYLIPGVIDDQVHFREPGLTHKADIATESRAAVAGGITSFIEQPNTVPQATTVELVEKKYERAAEVSAANYAFNIGATNDNVEELLKVDKTRIPGVKIFMGSSTGNMLVDDLKSLERIFSEVDNQLITHCEDEATIKANLEKYKAEFGDDIPMKYHPIIRSAEACYLSSSTAVDLAKKHDSRLHVYHISTGIETELFDNKLPLGEKKITAEACVHHLWFNDEDYDAKGSLIKWNPAVKTEEDRKTIWTALLDDRIDVIATDHAPHTREEKDSLYTSAPSGGPLVQHALVAMMEFVTDETITMEKLVEKMCHNPAILFNIKERGFIREGYHADLVLVEASRPWTVTDENVLSKCGWSPFEGSTFKARVSHTFVNGKVVYKNGQFDDSVRGERLYFDRD
ncbi:dihydroorotase [Phaeocystidibacter marisrubri]|uniref:Dihydroorotase n=1 Tax=Phaeocystidibacter marisrubri TaxID=1577780 RepID=A0A6L3ZF52_9FLAO|nr:dihydroorotase [Phaeocystidibacter marisrubri]KAB2816208.1 dihydroorotase [Phaeocystidibacter marisrubri]GGH67863.1 dihydroorotase [Phaeocystidibacter marisrubri]